MSRKNKAIGNTEQITPTCTPANPMDSFTDANNTSYRLNTSHNSSMSNESDFLSLSFSLENDIDAIASAIDIDELPAFEIRLISPIGRTPSPIETEDVSTPTRLSTSIQERLTPNSCRNNPEFVALQDINAQISPPCDIGEEIESSLSRTISLETIYEGVILHTPPRERNNLQNNRARTNLLEKVALNRFNVGKENQSPTLKFEMAPTRRTLSDFRCVTESCAGDENHNYC